MRITRFGFRNFRGIGVDGVELDLTKKVNVLIGPNNAGKSTILEACKCWSLHQFRWKISETDKHQRNSSSQVELIVEADWTPENNEGWPNDCSGRFEFLAVPGDWTFQRTPFDEMGPTNFRHFNHHFGCLTGRKFTSNHIETRDLKEAILNAASSAIERLKGAIPEYIQIPAFRQISEGSYNVSGAGIVALLSKWRHPDIGKEADKRKFQDVLAFLRHLLEMDDIDLEIPSENSRLVVSRGDLRLPLLENYGTGVHQLVILAVAVLQRDNVLFAIEEPEIHLHPRLQREMLRFLIEKTKNQYLITTHSPAFLSMPEHCHIVRLWLDKGVTKCKSVQTTETALEVLRDLGISAADIMQTRFVIWVEGPSDAIYLRRWLELAHIERITDEKLTEGVDFSIMFYGGACLPHLSVERGSDEPEEDEEETKKLIEILRINQNAAVIMDSDRKVKDGAIRVSKLRIEEECRNSKVLSWITTVREIENYLPIEAVNAAYEPDLNGEQFALSLNAWQKFDDRIKAAIPTAVWKAKFGYGKKKPAWAHRIAPHIQSLDGHDLRDRITELVAAIRAAR